MCGELQKRLKRDNFVTYNALPTQPWLTEMIDLTDNIKVIKPFPLKLTILKL
jgi:hypothetical protein